MLVCLCVCVSLKEAFEIVVVVVVVVICSQVELVRARHKLNSSNAILTSTLLALSVHAEAESVRAPR